jgi:hypothetical protein
VTAKIICRVVLSVETAVTAVAASPHRATMSETEKRSSPPPPRGLDYYFRFSITIHKRLLHELYCHLALASNNTFTSTAYLANPFSKRQSWIF